MSKLEENIDYELIPAENDFWQVRILTGDYVESVIQYGSIKLDGKNTKKPDDVEISFDFQLISSPDEDLNINNVDFQLYCGQLLTSILENAFANNEQIMMREVE